jgi:hypothetical protein
VDKFKEAVRKNFGRQSEVNLMALQRDYVKMKIDRWVLVL